jgi:TatA/E family protein of Tat protein translocase
MSIGPLEILIVVLIIVLIWRGPKILPQLGEATGKAVRSVRETIDRDSDETDGRSDSADPEADDRTSPRDE